MEAIFTITNLQIQEESSLYHSLIVTCILPFHGWVFLLTLAVFIGCRGEKMEGIPKIPSPQLTCRVPAKH